MQFAVVDCEGGVRPCPGAPVRAAIGRARGPRPAPRRGDPPRPAQRRHRRSPRSAGASTPASTRPRSWSRRGARREPWFCLEQPDRGGVARAALGCVDALEASGPDRFRTVAARMARRSPAAAVCEPDDGLAALGGFAFAPDGGGTPPWAGFAPASLHVPEVLLVRRARRGAADRGRARGARRHARGPARRASSAGSASCARRRCRCWTRRPPGACASAARCRPSTTSPRWRAASSGSAPA